jgi:RNA polymerase sigma-70 factor (ECF subfamily)
VERYDEEDTQYNGNPFGLQIILWGLEVTHMYAPTFSDPNTLSLWVKPCDVPLKQPDTAEAELVRLLQAGDETAFRELIDRYGHKIYRTVCRILRNRDEAEDVSQEVFTKVFFSIKSFQLRSSLYSWISRIAINESYGYLRKTRPVYESDVEDGKLSAIMQNTADRQPRADLAVMQKDFLNKLLMQVSEEERVLLVWKEVEGLSIEELSEMTGLVGSTIKVKFFRSRQRLVRAAARTSDSRYWARTSR